MEINLNRARGLLWGQAVGDAFGCTNEFSVPRARKPFPHLNRGPQTDMVGGGPFSLKPGEVTDDTQMAVCLADSLTACGEYNPADAASRYCRWMKTSFDIGRQTQTVLTLIARGSSATETGFTVWEATDRQSAPNGSLMRISPVAVFFADNESASRSAALLDSSITHADPRCLLACAAFVAALRHALVHEDASSLSMHRAAAEEIQTARVMLDAKTPRDTVEAAVAALSEDLELATHDDPNLESRDVHMYLTAGFVRVAFRLAFWELLHAPDFESCLLDCSNRGGDADTNTAIAGALYGALTGEDAIPKHWRECVAHPFPGIVQEKPVATMYHPLRLFQVLEKHQ